MAATPYLPVAVAFVIALSQRGDCKLVSAYNYEEGVVILQLPRARNVPPAEHLSPRVPHAVDDAQLLLAPKGRVLEVRNVLEEALAQPGVWREVVGGVRAQVGGRQKK